MTGTRNSATSGQAVATVPTGGGHGGPPNVVVGTTGSGYAAVNGWVGRGSDFAEEANNDRVA